MDLFLVHPGNADDIPCEHLGIAGLKSYLIQQGYRVDTLDLALEQLDLNRAVRLLIYTNPAVIGVSMLDQTKKKGLDLIRLLRKSGYGGKIVAGGYFPTFHADPLLNNFPEIDVIVRGEGEQTLLELMNHHIAKEPQDKQQINGISYLHHGQVKHNPPRPLIRNLDDLPLVDRKYALKVLKKKGHLRVSASRGCWGNCSFCDINSFYTQSPGRKWRSRSMIHFVEELKQLKQQTGADYFILNDDNFMTRGNHNRRRAMELNTELKKRDLFLKFELMGRVDSMDRYALKALKDAGLQRMFLGVESFDQAHLQRFNKGTTVRQNLKAIILLKKLKIDCIISVILADAFTRLSDLIKQYVLLFWISRRFFNSRDSKISINEKLEIYRGSALYHQYKKQDLLTDDNWFTGYRYRLKMLTALRLKLAHFEKMMVEWLSGWRTAIKNSKQIKEQSDPQNGLSFIKNPINNPLTPNPN